MRSFFVTGIAFAAAVLPVLAVDGGFGRSIPGTWVLPGAGVVGPASGFSFTTLPIGFMGAMGGSREDPIAGVIYNNVEANTSINVLIPGYVYKSEAKRVSVASAFMVPVNWWGVSTAKQINGTPQNASSSNASIGDVVAIPLTVGIHFSDNNNLAISTWVFAPTGLFRAGNISNVGMGVWTVMPNFAHTYYWEKHNVEVDNFVGFDIYSHNAATNYSSGTMFHWDGMAIKYFSNKKFGVGAVGSNLTQITDDKGPLADTLQGFAGRAWGVGPMLCYTARNENPGLSFQVRWINEFNVTNMIKGNTLMAGISLSLK